jgi:hypothetical protein
MCQISNNETLKTIYFVHFHNTVRYGIINWGNSSYSFSKKIFTPQKKVATSMADAKL